MWEHWEHQAVGRSKAVCFFRLLTSILDILGWWSRFWILFRGFDTSNVTCPKSGWGSGWGDDYGWMQPPTKLETQHDRALVTNTWNPWGVVALMAEGKGLWQGGTWFIYNYIYIYLFIYVAVRWLVLCVRFKLKIVAADGNDDVGHGGDDEGWKRRPGNGTFAEAFALQRWYHRKRCQRGKCWASPQDCQEKEPPTPQPQIQNLVRSSWNMLKLCQRQGRPTSHATQGKPMGPTYGAKGAGNPTADSECLGISTLDLHQIERNLWE